MGPRQAEIGSNGELRAALQVRRLSADLCAVRVSARADCGQYAVGVRWPGVRHCIKTMAADILDDVLSRDPTSTLYHYTTQAGFLGIIRDKEIWATHTQYLNDAREYSYAIDVVATQIHKRLVDAVGDGYRVLADMAEGIKGIESMNVCVCSFSEHRDSLSQWRAYGGSTSGYAIGFGPAHVAELVKREGFYLAPCLYEPGEQVAVIEALVERVFEQNMQRLHGGDVLVSGNPEEDWRNSARLLFPRGGNLGALLHRFAPILKDKSFSDEKEWRIISRPLACTNERFSYRCGSSMLIPYYRVAIAYPDQPLKLDEVVIGPTPHVEQARRAAWSFLVSQDLEKVPVEPSAVPYRNW